MMETLVETFKNSSIQYGALDLETVKEGELKADLAKDLQSEYGSKYNKNFNSLQTCSKNNLQLKKTM